MVSGISHMFKFRSCIKCKSKVQITGSRFGRCTNASCSMLQNLDDSKETFSAILMISSEDKEKTEVHAFERELRNIANIKAGDITEENLLEATKFSCCKNSKGILTHVWR